MRENILTLKSEVSGNLAKSIVEIALNRYVIPLYQRSFAWGEKEIQQLVQDTYESCFKDEKGSYFIGSLVLIKRSDGLYEVIDGQQRLTVISLLLKYLFPSDFRNKFLSYDSREDINYFLDFYYSQDNVEDVEKLYSKERITGVVQDYFNAITFIAEAPLTPNSDNPLRLKDLSGKMRAKYASYFLKNVKMVMVEMPPSTDVASYFEIMNNRGLQLQHHEVLKSLLMDRIDLGSPEATSRMSKSFAEIWDACAEMDFPVQKNIAKEKLEILFGKEYDTLKLDNIEVLNTDLVSPAETRQNLFVILNEHVISSASLIEDEVNNLASGGEFKAIIDFPNFLMHVLKIKYNDYYLSSIKIKEGLLETNDNRDNYGIPLNEKYLLDVYDLIKEQIEPIDFICTLLHYRIVFDKYVVRFSESNENDDLKWALRRVKKISYKGYDRVDNNSNTFSDNIQPFVVKALSMLQVSHRQRRYKNYLYSILSWFKNTETMDGASYLDKLNGLILNEFERNETYDPLMSCIEYNGESLSLGTRTPHFLFNFLDYLYWTAWKKGFTEYEEVKYVNDFDYAYWNSIEHHLPQSFEQRKNKDRKMINSLGNLCLISKAMNSRLNAEDPIGKARQYYKDGFAPLRRIIYQICKNEGNWDEEQIKNHYKNLVFILKDRRHILGLDALDFTDLDVIRAMLCLKDITIHVGSYQSGERWNFFMGASRAKEVARILISWKVDNPDKTWEDFIEERLSEPANFRDGDGNYEEWRMVFVKYPYLLEYCEQGNFGWEKDGRYISMIHQVRFGHWGVKEMRSFILGQRLHKYDAEVHADGIHIPVEIAERPGPNLHIWLEPHTSNWCYEICIPEGVRKERDILTNNGWEKNKSGNYFNPQEHYLLEDHEYGIEESIMRAYAASIILLKEIQFNTESE